MKWHEANFQEVGYTGSKKKSQAKESLRNVELRKRKVPKVQLNSKDSGRK